MAGQRSTVENQRRLRLFPTCALALYGIPCLLRPESGRLLDAVDLAIHETGHLVFAPFGEFFGARAQALPLVGGGEHDCAYLLGRLGWLQYDQAVALDIRLVGAAIYAYSIVSGFRSAWRLPSTDESATAAESA